MFLQFFKLALVVFSLQVLVACGPSVRTADGDCYYRGKGLLSLGATLLDGTVAFAHAKQEEQYQRDQITLQRLHEKLNAIDTDTLQSDYEIRSYNNDVNKYNRLVKNIQSYQEEKQRRLKDGPTESFSKQVDESGECQ